MPNHRYDRGSKFEREVSKKLTELGWFCMRSAGSHSLCDVLAVKRGLGGTPYVAYIQCKSSNVSSIPDLKELLKRTEQKKLRQKYYKENGIRYPCFQETNTIPTNVVLLEELNIPEGSRKILLHKGKGNVLYGYIFKENSGRWIGRQLNSLEEYFK